jgi:pimeloyl-ACP methyl ester carboxylesterase
MQSRPVLLIDGFSPFPSSMGLLAYRFQKLGIPTRTVSLNLRTLRRLRDLETFAAIANRAGNELCGRTGSDRYDVVAYSAGGVAALYGAKRLRAPRLVHSMVTLGSPFDGSWVSWPALVTLPISRISAQLLPDSDFLRALHHDPLPPTLRLLCIGGDRDRICRGETPYVPGAERLTLPAGHLDFLVRKTVFRQAADFLFRAA